MYQSNKLSRAVKLAIAASATSAVLAMPNAMAYEENGAEEVERISVTGSRIKRTDIESSSPVHVTTSEDIKLSGFTRIEDLLNSLPQIEAGQTSFTSNGASGTSNLDLRGLGPNRTLVLVNGRRLQSGGVYSQSPDINQIPAALVKQAEIMTGGGASTYGADAVAGVVNFIMDKEFEGLEITAGAAGYQHNNDNDYIQNLMDERGFEYPEGSSGIDGKSYNLDITAGGSFADGKGHAVAYATWRRNDELRQAARDYSSCALSSSGTSCGGSGNAIVPNFYIGTVGADDAIDWNGFGNYITLTPDSGFENSSGNVYNYAPVNHFMRPDEKFSLGAFVDYEVNDHFHPFMEMMYMNDRTVAQIAESGTFFNEAYVIPAAQLNAEQQQFLSDNYGIGPDDSFATYIGKRNVEGGPRSSGLEHNSFRVVLGSEGEINDNWFYEFSVNYGSTSSSASYKNDFFAPRIATAVDSDKCAADADCLFYDVFTYNGVSEESAASLTGVAILNGVTSTTVINGFVSGETNLTLPTADSPIAVVLGSEYRKEEFERLSDEVFEKGLLLGQGGPTTSIVGGYSVREIFAEASIPLLSGVDFAENVNLDLGYRYSDYSTSGGDSTYKIALDWSINDDWKLRGSYNRAVRAPNVAELFNPQSIGLWQGSDPCSGAAPEYTAAQCANTGVTASQYGSIAASPASQYNGFFGGNPELQPEIADTYAFGVVANPTDNLNFTIDYWSIELEDVIGSIDAELTVEQCALTANPAFCDNVKRSSAGSLWVGQAGFVQATNINLASRKWEGVDLSVNFLEEEVVGGTLRMNLNGSYMMTKQYEPLPGVPTATYDCAGNIDNGCFAQPDWRHTAKVSYDMDTFWTASVVWRYFGAVDYTEGTDEIIGDGISSQSYIDLKASFDVSDNIGVLVGVNNVLDKEPPMVGGSISTNANTVAGFYDSLGRYLHTSVTFKF